MKSNKNNVKRKSPPPLNTNKKFPSIEGQTSIKDFFVTSPIKQTRTQNENNNNKIINNNNSNNNNNNIITPIKKTTKTTTTVIESFDDTKNVNLIQQFQKSATSSPSTPNKLPTPINNVQPQTSPIATSQESNFFKTVKTTTTTETFEEFLLATSPQTKTTTTTTNKNNNNHVESSPTTSSSLSSSSSSPTTSIIIEDDENNSSNIKERSRYYLNDFLIVTETVYNRDKHLLIEDEKDYIEGMIETLDRDSQHLFVRLYNRKGPWFQVDSLNTSYQDEIKNIKNSIETLVEYGFIEYYKSENHDYNEIAQLLKVDQLKSIVGGSSNPSKSPSKATYLEILSGVPYKGQATLIPLQPIYKKKVENLVKECIKIKTEVVELWRMIHHLYFYSWSIHNSQSMIVNNIMGIKYPEYTVWKSKVKADQQKTTNGQPQLQIIYEDEDVIDLTQSDANSGSSSNNNNNNNNNIYDIDLTKNESIFTTRESLISYENAKKLEEKSINVYESGGDLVTLESILQICSEELGRNVSKKVKYSFALRFTPGWVYTRILSWSIGVLEKLRKYQQCLDYLMLLIESPYCRGKRGSWWLRMIINHKHLHRSEDALSIAERCLKEDIFLRSGDRLAIEKQLLQLASPPRRWKVPTSLLQFSNKLKEPIAITIHREKVSNNQPGHKSKYLFLEPKIIINKIKKIVIRGNSQEQSNNSQKSNDSIITTTTVNNSQNGGIKSSQNIYIDEETTLEITSDDELFPSDQINKTDKKGEEKEKDKENVEKSEEDKLKTTITTATTTNTNVTTNAITILEEEEEEEEITEIYHGSVEDISLEYYSINGGWKGVHCETSIFMTLYVLYFWDIIFDSNVPHVFQSPFQNSPLDFGSDEFYFTRKESIDNRIKQLEQSTNDQLLSLLNNAWLHNGCEVRGVNWKICSLDQLSVISKCLGGKLIAFISRLFNEDFKSFSKGMPDLFLWKLNDDNSGSIKFVEVKGPGDRLRDQQRIWIDMLVLFGCSVEVCNVKNKKD